LGVRHTGGVDEVEHVGARSGGRPGPGREGRRARRTVGPRLTPVATAIVVAALLAAGCATTARRAAEDVIESRTEGTFYRPPAPLPAGRPGQLIRSERLLGAPNGAHAWRVLYHSRDVTGADVAVSGVVVAPDAARSHGPRTVVAWGHPTTGAAPRCAPSIGVDPFDLIEGLKALLTDGYVVAASDYPGMGSPSPPSYLIGTSEGNSVLDAARAAAHIPQTHAGSDVLLWGHSQGGQAVLFAAQDAPTYAPDLHVRAVAVAAPAAELGQLLTDDLVDDSGVTLGSYAFDAYVKVYGPTTPDLSLSTLLTPAGVAATPKMAGMCLFGQHRALHAMAKPLVGHYLAHDPAEVPAWSTLLAQNTPGAAPIGIPILVAQGLDDTLVRPATTAAYVAHLCATGEHVDYRTYTHQVHATIAVAALGAVQSFFGDVLAAKPTISTC